MLAIRAEYLILDKMLGKRGEAWDLERQTLLEENGKHYDLMSITLKNGEQISIYFDITKAFS